MGRNTNKMSKNKTILGFLLLVGVVIVGLSLAITSVAEKETADNAINTQISGKEIKDVKVTMEDAKNIALLAVPGTIVKEDLKNEKGNVVYNMEINDGKTTIAVKIDAVTGTVMETEIED
jgi:uncharacterized membrane protein YkoI